MAMTNPKPGDLPQNIADALDADDFKPSAVTILLVDLYLRREDLVDRIDDLSACRIDGAEQGRDLSKLDLGRLYVEVTDSDKTPEDVCYKRLKGLVLGDLADAIGFYSSPEQDEVVKEQMVQIWLYLATGTVAPRMPTLPASSAIDGDLKRVNSRGNGRPSRRVQTAD